MEITRVGPFLDYFERIRELTMKVIDAIPRERIRARAPTTSGSFQDLSD